MTEYEFVTRSIPTLWNSIEGVLLVSSTGFAPGSIYGSTFVAWYNASNCFHGVLEYSRERSKDRLRIAAGAYKLSGLSPCAAHFFVHCRRCPTDAALPLGLLHYNFGSGRFASVALLISLRAHFWSFLCTFFRGLCKARCSLTRDEYSLARNY